MLIINGTLSEKRLILAKIKPNQGEAGNVELRIQLEPYEDTKYYLEFLCPYGRKFLSKEIGIDNNELIYVIPSCVFLVAGKIYVQLIGRKDNNIVIKSNKSADAAFEVMPSIDGAENIEGHQDFITNAENLVQAAEEAANLAEQKAILAEQKTQAAQDIIDAIGLMIANGELNGKNAYNYALEGGFSGSEAEFCNALSNVKNIVEDAPNGKNYLRKNGDWVEAVEIPVPTAEHAGKVLSVTDGENGAKYSLLPLENNDAAINADSEDLEAFARVNNKIFKGKYIISTNEHINGREGIFEMSYVFEGPIVMQHIYDTQRGIRYCRTKISDGDYGSIKTELIKPYKIENFEISPSAFKKNEYYYKASIELYDYLGFDVADNTIPMLMLAKNNQMQAYECNLNREVELSSGVLIVRASCPPAISLKGNLILMGVFN